MITLYKCSSCGKEYAQTGKGRIICKCGHYLKWDIVNEGFNFDNFFKKKIDNGDKK